MLRSSLETLFAEVLTDRRLLQHPFYQRWSAGELAVDELAGYAGQYRHFERALPDVLQAAVGGADRPDAKRLLAANLSDERSVPEPHVDLFDRFAQAVGAPVDVEAEPATAALVGLYRELARIDAAWTVAALAAYELQSPDIARSKADGLRTHYGLDAAQTRFWDVHGEMDTAHSDWTLDALACLTDDEPAVRSAAQQAADAWWSFLDERQRAACL